MPDTNHSDDAAFKVALGHTLDAHLTELRRSKARASAWGAAVCVIALALASGAIAAGTWWGYNRGVEEAQQIWATRGPQQMRQWVNLMMANDDIVSLVRRCDTGEVAHVKLLNGEDVCQIPLSLHPVGARREVGGGD